MLDVHPPHERVHGWRDFLLHLLTITIGLFIALMLEGLVEWRHHVHLVKEARETLRGEIEHNRQKLEEYVPALGREHANLDGNLATLRLFQENAGESKAHHDLSLHIESKDLDDTAWQTAQASGALGYMSYAEAQRFALVYSSQRDLKEAERLVTEDVALFEGLVARFDLQGKGKLNADAADAMAERIGILRAHVLFVAIAAKETLAQEKAILNGQPAPGSFSENLQ